MVRLGRLTLGVAAALLATGCPQGTDKPTPSELPPSAKAPAAPTISMAAVPKPGTASIPNPSVPKRPPREVLEGVVRTHCLDVDQPWALAHGILALGPELKLASGELAVDALASKYLGRDDEKRLAFSPLATTKNPWPHPGMFAKVLLAHGVKLQHQLPVKEGGKVPLRRVLVDLLHDYEPGATLYNDAWKLEGLAAIAKPARLEEVRKHALDVLAYHQSYWEDYVRAPTRVWEKPFVVRNGRRAPTGIHRYFCGGFHLMQAVQQLHGKLLPPRLKLQYDILWVRIDKESEYWDGKLGEARAHGKARSRARYERLFLSQKLKIQAHALETYVEAVKLGALTVDEATKKRSAAAYDKLAATITELDQLGIYGTMSTLGAREHQVYLDLVGDSAHALHAWDGRKAVGL